MSNSGTKKTANDKEQPTAASQSEEGTNSSAVGDINNQLNISSSSCSSGKARKRKHCEIVRFSDLESEFEDCDLGDAVALETKLRKVARRNSLSRDEMIKLLHKFVKNEHILALVTLKAEDELAREKAAAEQRAIIITDTPSVPKLTRAKARELNKTPMIPMPQLIDTEPPEIAKLIDQELNSEDEDEEYMFKEEDFVSDDDPNNTASDLDSNPRTPQTPAASTEVGDSPVKLSEDGCFKVPHCKIRDDSEELRIAARTRSKLCLQQTTIEDIQSEFVPPDVEEGIETEVQGLDEDWMQFLTDFTRPLNTSLVGDDDDPINDPEYVAAEKERVDAEELKNVNISKKELAALMSELFGDLNEGISLESIELETPQKFLMNYHEDYLNTPNTSPERLEENADIGHQLNYVEQSRQEPASQSQSCTVSSSNTTQQEMAFHPNVMSTPSTQTNNDNANNANVTLIPVALPNSNLNVACSPGSTVAIPSTNLNSEVEFIALPIPGQPNHFNLAKIISNDNSKITSCTKPMEAPSASNIQELAKSDICYGRPYETNYTGFYISVKRHAIAEFKEKFGESLKQAQVNQISSTTTEAELDNNTVKGFTKYQYDLFQQQMRIHVQMLTQTYIQTYCHPGLWRLAKKPKEMLMELQTKSKTNTNFNAWNLDKAINLIEKWEQELNVDTEENRQLMAFMHREIELTNHHTRQIPRFPPRILECFLQSNVFMYPEYLPRMPFSPKVTSHETFSPVESYLIAMGLEKHIKLIAERKEKIRIKSSPLHMAHKRLAKDTVHGKTSRAIWNHMMRLKNAEYYNPIKYFFEHNKAPPVEYTPIIGFENNSVLPPKDRVNELPLVFQKYLEEKNAPPKESKRCKKSRAKPPAKASERNCFFDFVREAVGEDIISLENSKLSGQPDASVPVASADSIHSTAINRARSPKPEPKRKRRAVPQNLTINVNYVFGASPVATCVASSHANTSYADSPSTSTNNITASLNTSNNTTQFSAANQSLQDSSINQSVNTSILFDNKYSNDSDPVADTSIVSYNFDVTTQRLEPCFLTAHIDSEKNINRANLTRTNFTESHAKEVGIRDDKESVYKVKKYYGRRRSVRIFSHVRKLNRNTFKRSAAYREKRKIRQRCGDLITAYGSYLETLQLRYQHTPIVQHYYRKFQALELYTNLLRSLKKLCGQLNCVNTHNRETVGMASSGNSPSGVKRTRNSNADDESSPSSQRMARKINRQEENFRHMLLPDTPEEANRKDAIYAFNFYEKVEEAFRSSNRIEDCKKFNAILKSFDPKNDKVSDLYYKLEKLFLPEHPELAQVFLTFLLPSDAAEIGKFFEHFMINNMTTFVNKLNVYFNKQPAQIRKIYNCLNELADDPDVTIKKLETRILPLLKGNQFLIDWFMQQFPQGAPPERLLGTAEHILNLKEQQSNKTGEYVETLTDILDSPVNDNQTQSCQLRYINGRIFYGSKMLLPAKLSFMATAFKDNFANPQTMLPPTSSITACVHAIKDHGDKRLHSASELATPTTISDSNDDHDKSEEDDTTKTLIIDTTAEEDGSCSSFEPCDENTLKAHALRLNPSYYSSACYSSSATSTPNLNSNFQSHHPNAKKTSLNFNESEGSCGSTIAGKTSPRKYSNQSHQAANSPSPSNTSAASSNVREKRKSPSKKTKSPLNNTASRSVRSFNQPMVVIHETSSAIQCAKRLKCLVEEPTEGRSELVEESLDSKEHINIIARTKCSMKSTTSFTNKTNCTASNNGGRPTALSNCSEEVKQENTDDLEFLPEHPSITRSPFPALTMDTDSNEEDGVGNIAHAEPAEVVGSTTKPSTENDNSNENTSRSEPWTRDEDKVILIEMKLGSQNRDELYQRIAEKLPQRTMDEITARHLFLMDFLSKLQKK